MLGSLSCFGVSLIRGFIVCMSIKLFSLDPPGEFGMMDDVCLEDTEQYEVMLATANNPAYCYRNAPPASGPAGVPTQIYEQLP